jgi:antitoxin component YwqK of YwqJK toxin-antitoxin module
VCKIKYMKKILVTLLLTIVSFSGYSQTTAIKMKLRYWNESKQGFNQSLTKNGKILLDSIMSVTKVDTSKCEIIEVKDLIEYTNKKFLSNHSYTYISYSIYNGGGISKKYYRTFNMDQTKDKSKIILYHMSDEKTIDIVSLYIIQ